MDFWLSVFLNSIVFMIVGAAMVYVGMGFMFPRRRPLYVFVASMLIKGLLWSLYDASYVLGTMDTPEYLFQVVGTPILGCCPTSFCITPGKATSTRLVWAASFWTL